MIPLGVVPEVQDCSEFRRILNLPRRDWETKARDEDLVRVLTEFFAREGSDRVLKPVQAVALEEAADLGGLVCAAAVGAGKMTLNLLLPVVMGASKTALLVPASMEEQTERDLRELLKYWKRGTTPWARIFTYQSLGVESGETLLDGYKPDLIIADEAQYLRNRGASVTRRVGRYLSKNPDTKFCALTGSLTRKSLFDFAHLLIWALRLKAPVPVVAKILDNWARALDLKPSEPIEPGALLTLPGEGTHKQKFQKRLRETPGVIVTTEQSCDMPLRTHVLYAKTDTTIDDLFQNLDEIADDTYDAPDRLQRAALKQQFGCGFRYKWKYPAPKAWLLARRQFYSFCRQVIEESQFTSKPLDCERAVMRAYKDDSIVTDWKAIRGTFEPEPVPVWHSYSYIEEIEAWLAEHSPAIVFTRFNAVGDELSRRTGLYFYGEKGKTEDGRHISRADASKSAILSLDANRIGRNLQNWNKMLIAPAPSSSERLEQALGREHRQGQFREVDAYMLMGCKAHVDALANAIIESEEHIAEVQGHVAKILMSPPDYSPMPPVTKRWI
jgi:hypothetical protein